MTDQISISGLPLSQPLTGNEVLPMDQGSSTVQATAQQIANLAAGTNLDYEPATRTITSSTGGGVQLPEVSATIAGLVPPEWLGSGAPFASIAQGSKADTAIQPGTLAAVLGDYVLGTDFRLSNDREWSAATVDQVEAETGTATTRRAWTAQRVRQAVAAWWTATSTAAGRALVAAADAAAQRTALGLGSAAQGALSDAAPAAPAATASAGTSADVSRADHRHQLQSEYCVIPLSGASQAVAQGLLDTSPRWPRSEILLELPLWAVRDAPTGANMILDMRINGVSIFSTLPSIDATEQGSETAAVPGVFSAAFIASGYLIPRYSVVTWWAIQVGTGGGVGLKVSLLTRGA